MYISSIKQLKLYIEQLTLSDGEELMVMVADGSADDVEQIREELNLKGIKFFGAIFPGLLNARKLERNGFIVDKVKVLYSTIVLPYMMRFKMDIEEIKGATAIVFNDGLSPKAQVLVDTLYGKLGNNVKYIGGGAGFYSLQHNLCIFDAKGIYKDVMYVCVIDSSVEIAVDHGWKRIQGPFQVTKSEDNVLSAIDNEIAFEVYKHVIEEEKNITLSKEDFFFYAKEFPFGIKKGDKMDIVRDPISINEAEEIICVASIPEGSEVYVLNGDTDALLHSSKNIVSKCSQKGSGIKHIPLLFDCISRAMFMEERFEEELHNIQDKLNAHLFGALSIGEISSVEGGDIQIHNKSTVLGLLA